MTQPDVKLGCAFMCNLEGKWCDGYYPDLTNDQCHLIAINDLIDSGLSDPSGPVIHEIYERIHDESMDKTTEKRPFIS